jgi:hypothetical protein
MFFILTLPFFGKVYFISKQIEMMCGMNNDEIFLHKSKPVSRGVGDVHEGMATVRHVVLCRSVD